MKFLKVGVTVAVITIFAATSWAMTNPKRVSKAPLGEKRIVKMVPAPEINRNLKAGEWGVMVRLATIPATAGEAGVLNHHIMITVKDRAGKYIDNGKVRFEFLREGKVITSGDAEIMATPVGERGLPAEHYGSNVKLPEKGLYELKVTVTVGEITKTASTRIEVR